MGEEEWTAPRLLCQDQRRKGGSGAIWGDRAFVGCQRQGVHLKVEEVRGPCRLEGQRSDLGEGGFKGIWRGREKRKTKSPAAEGSSGCYSVPSTDTHTLPASQGPIYMLRGRHRQARSLILRDSARSVLDSAQQGRRSTQRVNPGPAASQSQGDLGPRSSSRPCPSLRLSRVRGARTGGN